MALPCKSCKKFHPATMNCPMAAMLIGNGFIGEPWASLNASILVVQKAAPDPVGEPKPEKKAKPVKTAKFDAAAYHLGYMRKKRLSERIVRLEARLAEAKKLLEGLK